MNITANLKKNWEEALTDRGKWIRLYTLLFLLLFLISFMPFFIGGKTFVWDLDGRDQMLPWLAYSGKWVRSCVSGVLHGTGIPMFDLSVGWGDDTIGFLGSSGQLEPIGLLLSAFVPVAYTEALYIFLVVARLYVAGLSFQYLCSFFKKDKYAAAVGTVVYLFCAYTVYCGPGYPYFINAMILLPVLIVQTERIIQKEKPRTFLLCIFYTALCGFYLMYMLCIMIVLFAIVRFFEVYPRGNRIRTLPKIVFNGMLLGILGAGLAAVVLLPSLLELFASARSDYKTLTISGSFAVHWGYFWTRFLTLITPKHIYALEWGIDYTVLAAIFFPSAILLFAEKRRYTLKILLSAAIIALFCPLGGWLFNGMQYVSNRWSFALVLLAAYTVTEMLPVLLFLDRKKKIICIVAVLLYLVGIFMSRYARENTYLPSGVFFLLATVFLMIVPSEGAKIRISASVKRKLCFVLVVMNVVVNISVLCSPRGVHWAVYFPSIGEETKRFRESVESIADRAIYQDHARDQRFDSAELHYNGSLYYGVPGTSIYSSTENENVVRFWQEMEGSGNVQNFKIYSTDQRTIFNTLLSIRWQIDDGEHEYHVPFGYREFSELDHYSIYENDFFLPLGYTYESTVSPEKLKNLNGIEKQEVLLQYAAVDGFDNAAADFRTESVPIPYSYECTACTWENGIVETGDGISRVYLSCVLPAGKECYLRLKNFNINGNNDDLLTVGVSASCGINVVGDGFWKKSVAHSVQYPWYYGRDDYLFCLGCAKEDRDHVAISFSKKGTFRLEDIELFALPLDNYPARVESLRAEPLENINMATNNITGTVDLSRDKILCLTVPYSKGWTAYVDGDKQEILKVNYAFMGLDLPKGYHEIEFRYCSPGLYAGLMLSSASLVILIVLFSNNRKRKKANGTV